MNHFESKTPDKKLSYPNHRICNYLYATQQDDTNNYVRTLLHLFSITWFLWSNWLAYDRSLYKKEIKPRYI
jgi:hypothetical protein